MEQNLEEALERAWKKIQDYCRDFAGLSTQALEYPFINPEETGARPDAFLLLPDGRTCVSRWYIDGDGGTEEIRYSNPAEGRGEAYQLVEEAVMNWSGIKQWLLKRRKETSTIYDFEV